MYSQFYFHFGRHRGGRGLGCFGKGFVDGGGMGSRRFGMGRKLASGDLQLMILGLLGEKPSHGYEIIKALDDRSKGFYVPSPGMVYPALTYLEELGHATVEAEGNRKLYRITEAGRQHLESNRARADALFNQFERVAERMDRVGRAMDLGGAGDTNPTHSQPSKALFQARHALRQALADKWNGSRDEQRRILDILERAAADILGTARNG